MVIRMLVILTALAAWAGADQNAARSGQPMTTLRTIIHVEPSTDSPLRDVVKIGFSNHLPLGLALGTGIDANICRGNLELVAGDITVAELIDHLNRQLPGYHSSLEDGIIDVTAKKLSQGGAHLLNLILPEFRANRATAELMAFTLWTFVRASIAPQAATGFVGAESSGAEPLEPMELRNATARQILNRIVGQGKGAVWVFRDPNVDKVDESTHMPFKVYGYVGDQGFLSSTIACSR